METLVMIIMILVGFTFVLKLTFHGISGIAVTTIAVAIFVGFSCEYAITMSKTQIADWLQQPDLMLDTSVLLAIDVACQIAFCFIFTLKEGGKMSRLQTIIYYALFWIPGFLIFPTLLSLLASVIFSMSGVEFSLIGWGLAAGLALAAPMLVVAFRALLPEADIRLELLFLVNLLILALGIITTVNGRTAAIGTNEVQWDAMGCIMAIILLGGITGMVIDRYKTIKKISKLQ